MAIVVNVKERLKKNFNSKYHNSVYMFANLSMVSLNMKHLNFCQGLGNGNFFLIVCFTSYFVFSIAVLPHSPGVVTYHLLLRRETRILGVAPFSLRIGILDLFVHRGPKSYIPTAFGKLWTTPGVRCMKHSSS